MKGVLNEPLPLKDDHVGVSSTSHRRQVYQRLLLQWKDAASSSLWSNPAPRSSHARFLVMERRELLRTKDTAQPSHARSSSWGNLSACQSDTISPKAQSAWLAVLLQRHEYRLSSIPLSILEKNQNMLAAGARVVAAPTSLTAKQIALLAVRGKCVEVTALQKFAPNETALVRPPPSTSVDRSSAMEAPLSARERSQDTLLGNTSSQGEVNGRSARKVVYNSRGLSMVKSMGPLKRGFQLVDLHAVVQNYVQWRHCLPKVEACFRVGDNRDAVLLSLVSALGVRLICSTALDVKVARVAATLVPADKIDRHPLVPLRLLDSNLCRPPALLHTGAEAGMPIYEVDSAEEVLRILSTLNGEGSSRGQCTANLQDCDSFENEDRSALDDRDCHRSNAHPTGSGRLCHSGSSSAMVTPIEVLIRLTLPPQAHVKRVDLSETRARKEGCLEGGEKDSFPGMEATLTSQGLAFPVEVEHGAELEDIVSILEATATASAKACMSGTSRGIGCGYRRKRSFTVVGFSLDLGMVCRAASTVASCSHEPSLTPGLASDSGLPDTPTGREREGEDCVLNANMETAVSYVLEAAQRATAWMASRGEAASKVKNVETGSSFSSFGDSKDEVTSASPAQRGVFHFRRLHVLGLGTGGACREPLSALKAALARLGPDVRPSVSADATEYLVAGGVCSLAASIIGKKVPHVAQGTTRDTKPTAIGLKEITSNTVAAPESAALDSMERVEGAIAGSEIEARENVEPSPLGSMYYIDDGCYGSLSGAALRGEEMQPRPLFSQHTYAEWDKATCTLPTSSTTVSSSFSSLAFNPSLASSSDTIPALSLTSLVPCTVWGPTCDGLDCVSRVTTLPVDLESGVDWLFFADIALRTAADATCFNGLEPPDILYCLRQQDWHCAPQ
ncbi:unnamed protein product [Choristocarpus tenellus]